VRRRAAFSRAAACCLAAACLAPPPVPADGGVPGWNRLVYLMYRVEVTNYCGLTTERVLAGFHRRQKALSGDYNLEPHHLESARVEAWKLAYKEWDNRGLGGFRGWCRFDAARYARQLAESPGR